MCCWLAALLVNEIPRGNLSNGLGMSKSLPGPGFEPTQFNGLNLRRSLNKMLDGWLTLAQKKHQQTKQNAKTQKHVFWVFPEKLSCSEEREKKCRKFRVKDKSLTSKNFIEDFFGKKNSSECFDFFSEIIFQKTVFSVSFEKKMFFSERKRDFSDGF